MLGYSPLYDEAICVAQRASRQAFLARDRRMVDNSSYCVSYCTRRSGGTVYTVRYAKKCGVPVFNTSPGTPDDEKADHSSTHAPGEHSTAIK